MRFRISSGGSFRISTPHIGYSSRGGFRMRLGGVSAGRSGARVSYSLGSLRASAGSNGITSAGITKNGSVFGGGYNASGAFVAATATVRVSRATTARGQREALSAGMLVPHPLPEVMRPDASHDPVRAQAIAELDRLNAEDAAARAAAAQTGFKFFANN